MTDTDSVDNNSLSDDSEILRETFGEDSVSDYIPSENEEHAQSSDEENSIEILASGKRKLPSTSKKPHAKRKARERRDSGESSNGIPSCDSDASVQSNEMRKHIGKLKRIVLEFKIFEISNFENYSL